MGLNLNIYLIGVLTAFAATAGSEVQAIASPCVRGGVVDVLGTKKVIKIFEGETPAETFIILGMDKYEVLTDVSDVVLGQLRPVDADGKPFLLKRLAIHTSAPELAKAKEDSALAFKLKKTETYEVPCAPDSNAVLYLTDNKNGMHRYMDRGSCFKLRSLGEEDSFQEWLRTVNVDGSFNSVGALLFPESVKGKVEGGAGTVDLVFINGRQSSPRYFEGNTRYNGRVRVTTASGGCMPGDYFVSGGGTWTGDKKDGSEIGSFMLKMIESRGPGPLKIRLAPVGGLASSVVAESGELAAFGQEFQISCAP